MKWQAASGAGLVGIDAAYAPVSNRDHSRCASPIGSLGGSHKARGSTPLLAGTTSRTGKLIIGILALIAEFENDIRRERQQDGINKAKAKGVRFGPKPILTAEVVQKIKELRVEGLTVPEIIRRTKLSKASIYRALA